MRGSRLPSPPTSPPPTQRNHATKAEQLRQKLFRARLLNYGATTVNSPDELQTALQDALTALAIPPSATVFLVHGHDHAARDDVARMIQQLTGDQPVILDEQASHGRTLVEKFEQHAADACFAVVLLTPDDVGGPRSGTTMRPRGRQNVVFELGYFFAAVGRGNVVVLATEGIERPSDVDGILYIQYPHSDWRQRLAREMRVAGLEVEIRPTTLAHN